MPNHVSDANAYLAPSFTKWQFTSLGVNCILWTVLVAGNAVDVLASRFAFSRGASELNPVVALLLDAYGIVGLAVVKAVLLAALLVLLPRVKGRLQVLLVFTCVVYTAVVGYHFVSLSSLA